LGDEALMLADTACPICGEGCKLLLPITASNYAFSCIIHHDFEVTKAGMEKKGTKLGGVALGSRFGQSQEARWNPPTMY
jgi:hypothetical protein